MTERPGFTMITTLWVMTVAGVMATAAALAGRTTVNATRNRVLLERAFWLAAGCAARAQAAMDAALRASPTYEDAAAAWRVLDRALRPLTAAATPECAVSLEAAGTRIDVNAAPDELLDNLFRSLGAGGGAPALVDALADWRDSDDVARPLGAEREWYEAARRDPPRNRPLADIRELARVRGFENLALFDSVLATEPGRVSLATAPVTVLAAVPGFTRETAERIVERREGAGPPADVMAVVGFVSAPSAGAIVARYPEIVRLTTPDPDAWILTVRARAGSPAAEVRLERRLVRAGRRAVVVATRSAL